MFKKEIINLKSYKPSQRFSENNYPVFLDWNEGPYEISDELMDLLVKNIQLKKLNRYPMISDKSVEDDLITHYELEENSIAIYNGSDAALQELLSCIVWNSRKVYYIEPEYNQSYQFAELYGADIHLIRPENPFLKFESIMRLGLTKQDVLYISNPCNPTGALLNIDQVEDILKTGVCLILDEAYIDFTNSSSILLTKNYKNLFILRTFSKAFGIAGLRAGYLCSNPENISQIKKVRNIKQVSDFARIGISWAIENINTIQKQINEIVSRREMIKKELNEINELKVYESHANFLLIKADKCSEFVLFCQKNGLLIRDRQLLHGLTSCFRVSIGTEAEMDLFKKLVSDFYEKK